MQIAQTKSQRMTSWLSSRVLLGSSFACVLTVLAACESQFQEQARDTSQLLIEPTQVSTLTLPAQLRAVDRNALFVELALSYNDVSQQFTATREDSSETWTTTLAVPIQTPFELTITWYDLADQERLDLVTSTRRF